MRKRMSAENRRSSILISSKALFAKRGLHGVSVSELARACDVNVAVLYQHFPSKEQLYRAVLDEFACKREDYVNAVLSGPDDFGNVLYRMTIVYANGRLADPDILRMELRSILEEDGFSEVFFESQWKGFTDYIEETLREWKDSSGLSIDVKVASMLYVGMVREMLIRCTLNIDHDFSDRSAEYLIKQIIKAFLRSLGFPPLEW